MASQWSASTISSELSQRTAAPTTSKKKDGAGYWKSAIDNKSGRVYYYNAKTRETSWTKPFELASPEEQKNMIRVKEESAQFFRDMEENIRKQFTQPAVQAQVSPSNSLDKYSYYMMDDNMSSSMFAGESYGSIDRMDYLGSTEPFKEKPATFGSRGRLPSSSSIPVPRMIRTISTIDDDILEILKYDERNKNAGSLGKSSLLAGSLSRGVSLASNSEDRSFSPMNDTSRQSRQMSALMSSSPLLGTSSIDSHGSSFLSGALKKMTVPSNPSNHNVIRVNPKTSLKRRNSTGTIYVGTTMSVQDNEATIKCVCVVFRAHIIEAAKRNAIAARQYDVFKDPQPPGAPPPPIPSLGEIKDFFMLIFSKSQLESECIIMALIYCERIIKETQGRFVVKHDNWKSILFACLVMASKVWDDLSMWNVDFSQISLNFNLQRVNALELAVLEALDYVIRVSASEYAKYYFHLRSMMARLGYHDNEPNKIAPLDITGARRLQLATERYEKEQTVRQVQSLRLDASQKSTLKDMLAGRLERHVSADGIEMENRLRHHSVTVGLEQIVHFEHNDADGIAHTSAKNTPRGNTVISPRFPITPLANSQK